MTASKELEMGDKTVIITGGNRGLGQETSLQLAKRGAKVIIACRDITQGEIARKEIVEESKNERVFVKKLDLSSLESVRAFANDILNTENQLDVLICNAGCFLGEKIMVGDGLENTFVTNYLGHFLLVNLLLPLLQKSQPSRIIMLSSVAYIFGKVDLENLNSEKSFNSFFTYSNVKLAIIMFVKELGRRLESKGLRVTVNAVHPGLIFTQLFDSLSFPLYHVFKTLKWIGSSVKTGAKTTVFLAVSEDVTEKSGKLFYWKRRVPKLVLFRGNNSEIAKGLWDASCQLVKINSAV